MDHHSRHLAVRGMGRRRDATLTCEALRDAMRKRVPNLVFDRNPDMQCATYGYWADPV